MCPYIKIKQNRTINLHCGSVHTQENMYDRQTERHHKYFLFLLSNPNTLYTQKRRSRFSYTIKILFILSGPDSLSRKDILYSINLTTNFKWDTGPLIRILLAFKRWTHILFKPTQLCKITAKYLFVNISRILFKIFFF